MKKTLLLSVAAAAAFTFGATTHDAKAEGLQPVNTNNVPYSSPFQFSFEPMNQQNLQSFLNTFFKNQSIWNLIQFQPSNCNQMYVPQISEPNPAPPVTSQTNPSTPASSGPNPSTPASSGPKPSTPASSQPKPSTPASSQKPSTPASKPSTPASSQQGQLSAYEQKVVDLTNAQRAQYGLSPLKVDPTLSKVAKAKAQDMNNLNYFDHTSPTYGSPFDMMKQFGVTYTSAGENIAMGQQTPEEVVQAWMDSPGHRANILNSSYNYIGVGYVSGKDIWTQEFISK
ncbi:CAP domain-containing protein [Ectobacillus polymachus]|uniref:CAP domain-containing protein n=1 Tax=Ectobacillus polymachus TaxID=1508806 RepID=UPI003A8B8197